MGSLIGLGVGRGDAVDQLAARAGLLDIKGFDDERAEENLARLVHALGGDGNPQVIFADAARLPDASRRLIQPSDHRLPGQPTYTNGCPSCLPPVVDGLDIPALYALELEGGVFIQIGGLPVVLAPDGRTIVRDYSSRSAGLIRFYEIDIAAAVRSAPSVRGTVIVLVDDIPLVNFCHWLVDTLPRLVCVDNLRDVTVVVGAQHVSFKHESLRLCGLSDEQVLYLPDFTAIRAERLVVPSTTREIVHPANRAARWATDFLRARVGLAGVLAALSAPAPRRLYVSRADASGRRVLNDAALAQALEPYGYETVTLTGLRLAAQVRLFSQATHVVALHGAGLANTVFCPAASRLLELFPASYGTPAYYMLASGAARSYATYIAHDVRPSGNAQTDDVVIDVADFVRCTAHLL